MKSKRKRKRTNPAERHELCRIYGSTLDRIRLAARRTGLPIARIIQLAYDQAGTELALRRFLERTK